MPPSVSLAEWVVGAVAAGLLSGLAFFLRRAIEGLEKSITTLGASLGARMDALAAVVNSHNTDVAVLRRDMEHLQKRLERLEEQIQQVREG